MPVPSDLGEQLPDGLDDRLRGDEAQAVVVPLGADALVAVLAGHIVVEDAMGHAPRRVLRVRQRIEVDDRRPRRPRRRGPARCCSRSGAAPARSAPPARPASSSPARENRVALPSRRGSPRSATAPAGFPVNTTCMPDVEDQPAGDLGELTRADSAAKGPSTRDGSRPRAWGSRRSAPQLLGHALLAAPAGDPERHPLVRGLDSRRLRRGRADGGPRGG